MPYFYITALSACQHLFRRERIYLIESFVLRRFPPVSSHLLNIIFYFGEQRFGLIKRIYKPGTPGS